MKIIVNEKKLGFGEYAVIIAVAVIFLVIFGAVMHSIGKDSKVDEDAVSTLAEVKIETDTELNQAKADLESVKQEMEQDQAELAAFREYKQNKDQMNSELENVKGQLAQKQTELADLTNQVDTIKNAPKQFTAGNYTVGTDLPAGTYDIQWVSGSGNFYKKGGSSINEIFSGDEQWGIKEYKNASLKDGNTFEVSGNLNIQFILK